MAGQDRANFKRPLGYHFSSQVTFLWTKVLFFCLKVCFTDDLKYINDTLDTESNTVSEKARPSTDCDPNLKELIDFQYHFNHDMPQGFSINKTFDYNKSNKLFEFR